MDLITDGIYIGNIADAQQVLTSGDMAVLSAGAEFSENEFTYIPLKNDSDTRWKVLSIWDGHPGMITTQLKKAWNFIDNNKPVLVHCMAGQSRSVSIVWSYLLQKGMDPLKAYLLIKKARPEADPYPVFLMEILSAFNSPDSYIKETVKQIEDVNKMFRG